MGRTNIEWADETDNIIIVVDEVDSAPHGWWCRKISKGCAHCYAEDVNDKDFFGGNHLPYAGSQPLLKLREDIIQKWARQRKPRSHFVCSMTDVCGEWVPQEWVNLYLDGMRAAPKQTFLILTKRADWMAQTFLQWLKLRGLRRMPPNIRSGVSIEDQDTARDRLPHLLRIPGPNFVSYEPALEEVNVAQWLLPQGGIPGHCFDIDGELWHEPGQCDGGILNCSGLCCAAGIEWFIPGGESGKDARPCYVEHIRSAVRQCADVGVACFVKQLGSVPISDSDDDRRHCGSMNLPHPFRLFLQDRKGGDMSEWPEDLRVRQYPKRGGRR